MADPLAGLAADVERQRRYFGDRAPVYARLCQLLSQAIRGEVAARLRAAWDGRRFGIWFERPLLLLAALRDEALREGRAHPLADALAGALSLAAATAANLDAALAAERRQLWQSLAARRLQTNDTTRAVAWLWPAAISAELAPERPVALADVGASAGLNLVADALAPLWRAGDHALAVAPLPPIAWRRGFDPRPVELGDAGERRWLRACVWPEDAERLARLDAALAAHAALGAAAPVIERARAEEVPARLPAAGASGPRILAYQSIVRDYLEPGERRRYEAGMRAWLGACDPGAALWIELEIEAAQSGGELPATLSVHVATGGGSDSLSLARTQAHPRELVVDAAAAARLRALLR